MHSTNIAQLSEMPNSAVVQAFWCRSKFHWITIQWWTEGAIRSYGYSLLNEERFGATKSKIRETCNCDFAWFWIFSIFGRCNFTFLIGLRENLPETSTCFNEIRWFPANCPLNRQTDPVKFTTAWTQHTVVFEPKTCYKGFSWTQPLSQLYDLFGRSHGFWAEPSVSIFLRSWSSDNLSL